MGDLLVGIVSTVRVSLRDLEMFVNYHLNSGIDRMFLFFDDPDDPCLDSMANDGRLACVRCDDRYWGARERDSLTIEERQIHNANYALEFAKRESIDWLIHIDSDELLFAGSRTIKHSLAVLPREIQCVSFPTLEALPEPHYTVHEFRQTRWFKSVHAKIPYATTIARLLGCRQAFKGGFFKAHSAGKSAVRVTADMESMGIHRPQARRGAELRAVKSRSVFTLHYDCCTLAAWLTKWMRRYDGTAAASRMRFGRKTQFKEFVAAYESGSTERLHDAYRRQYWIPRYERAVLRALGLLWRVRLNEQRFLPCHEQARQHEP